MRVSRSTAAPATRPTTRRRRTRRRRRSSPTCRAYGTRQSNKSDDGGGAIYGCRATNTASNTCVRATNLANGQAFSFNANGGNQVGSHHVVQQERRAVHDERDRRRHRPERRPGRRPERVADPDRGVDRGRHVGEQVRRHQRRRPAALAAGPRRHARSRTPRPGVYTVTFGGEHQRVRLHSDGAERDGGDRDGRPRGRDAPAGAHVRGRRDDRRAGRCRHERAPDHHLLRQVNGIAGARGCAPAPTRP